MSQNTEETQITQTDIPSPNFSSDDDIGAMKDELQSEIDNIEKSIPDDPVARLAEVKEGTDEHLHQSELVDRVKEINSTGRILRATKVIRWIGYVALFIGAIIKLMGVTFDINFHLPFFKDVVGESGLFTFGLFITAVILAVSHIAPGGLINNKWRSVPRFILVWLFMFALSASIYFDYRAITNYTTIVMEKVKDKKLQSSNTTEYIATQRLKDASANLSGQIEQLKKQLSSIAERLKQIANEREKYNAIITAYASKQKHTKAQWLNQKTANKALGTLDKEEDRLLLKQKSINAQIVELGGEIDTNTEKLKGEVSKLDAKLKEEQHARIIFLFVLVIFIEVFSFGSFLADFLEDKNLKTALKEELDNINSTVNDGAVLKNHIRQVQLQTVKNIGQDLQIGRHMIQAINTSGHLQLMGQSSTINQLTQNTATLTRATNDMAKMAVGGIASSYKAGFMEKMNRELMREMDSVKQIKAEPQRYSDEQKKKMLEEQEAEKAKKEEFAKRITRIIAFPKDLLIYQWGDKRFAWYENDSKSIVFLPPVNWRDLVTKDNTLTPELEEALIRTNKSVILTRYDHDPVWIAQTILQESI